MATEKKLIDADAEIATIKENVCKNCNNCNGVRCRACWVDSMIGFIDEAPTVDAVEVVRCKDCVRGRTELHTRAGEVIKCSLFRYDDVRQYKDPTDYCSHGVRKDREGK